MAVALAPGASAGGAVGVERVRRARGQRAGCTPASPVVRDRRRQRAGSRPAERDLGRLAPRPARGRSASRRRSAAARCRSCCPRCWRRRACPRRPPSRAPAAADSRPPCPGACKHVEPKPADASGPSKVLNAAAAQSVFVELVSDSQSIEPTATSVGGKPGHDGQVERPADDRLRLGHDAPAHVERARLEAAAVRVDPGQEGVRVIAGLGVAGHVEAVAVARRARRARCRARRRPGRDRRRRRTWDRPRRSHRRRAGPRRS